jgi:hypothetical protein
MCFITVLKNNENRDFKKRWGERMVVWKLDREGGYGSILLPYNTQCRAL